MGILTLDNVSYNYRNRYQITYALKNVSCDFETGKIYAIIGKSGSGKTTMLSLLAGLDLPTTGDVLFNGESTAKLNRDRYRRDDVAVIYQSFNLLPLLTAVENVMYPIEMHGEKSKNARKQAEDMIESVGLPESIRNRYPTMMSGGEQQRVAIARALASNTRIILADEPTGNLDTENGRNVIKILKELAHDKKYCVIIVTHDNSIADESDVVYKMSDGVLTLEKEQ